MSSLAPSVRRAHVRVSGTVQGVGFRPHVYRLAHRHALSGFVRNDERGVELEVEGSAAAVDAFLRALRADAPPLAVLESVRCADRPPLGGDGFEIRTSTGSGRPDAPVTPDSATCADCLAELFDPTDRRYRYPFINCTHCGPRFTIVRGVPYDRPLTSMAGFAMCRACRAEYEDPSDRRFHAQPNACSECGPVVSLAPAAGAQESSAPESDPVAAAAGALADGEIVAVKGIGGYHLACRADDEAAVARLRARKHREDRPFALMTRTAARAADLVELSDAEREQLQSPARPIVLAGRRADAAVAASVAPGAAELGVMLAYSPLHHLLLADLNPLGVTALVLTSGNLSDEPIAFTDQDARDRLAAIADRILSHDRPIETRTDDSVLRVIGARPVMIRRSRGYVPAALSLPGGAGKPLLACGAELKHTFCLARGNRAWVSHHIGDLANYETLESFRDGVAHFERLFAVTPEVVAHDLHPDYLSTAYAHERLHEREDIELVAVQHHHAHLAACLAEHGVMAGERPVVGAIYDGTGFGTDATIWGGELLGGDTRHSLRLGHLHPVRLPGGEQAIRQPWRMACAWLHEAVGPHPAIPRTLAQTVSARDWSAVSELVARGFRAPVTTSMGRLLDGVAALCGIRPTVSYEGQASIELEVAAAAVRGGSGAAYPMGLAAGPGGLVLDPREAVRAVSADLGAGVSTRVIAARFHAAVIVGTVTACARACEEQGADTVVLAGGVFQNRILLTGVRAGLAGLGLRVLVPERLPIGDGGIAFGQAAVAAAQLRGAA